MYKFDMYRPVDNEVSKTDMEENDVFHSLEKAKKRFPEVSDWKGYHFGDFEDPNFRDLPCADFVQSYWVKLQDGEMEEIAIFRDPESGGIFAVEANYLDNVTELIPDPFSPDKFRLIHCSTKGNEDEH